MARTNRSVPAASWPGHVEPHLNTPIPTRESRNDVSSFLVRLNFHGDLSFFLGPKRRPEIIERQLAEKTSIKDVIESCGVPHPEVDLIDRKSTRLNSSHRCISYAVFCSKK